MFSIPQILRIYKWIWKKMFSIAKNEILISLRTLRILQGICPKERPWIQQTKCEIKTLQAQICIQWWFYEEQGAKFI